MENKKWYEGQEVWDKTVSYEAGIVHNINFSPDFPVVVIFGDVNEKINAKYSIEGALEGSILITLSTKPYKIIMEGFSQEVEEELPKRGQLAWGLGDGAWHVGYFLSKPKKEYILSTTPNGESSFWFTEITTKNPYEVEEEDREPKVGDMCFFWDNANPKTVCCGILSRIAEGQSHNYFMGDNSYFVNCSLKNPLIK